MFNQKPKFTEQQQLTQQLTQREFDVLLTQDAKTNETRVGGTDAEKNAKTSPERLEVKGSKWGFITRTWRELRGKTSSTKLPQEAIVEIETIMNNKNLSEDDAKTQLTTVLKKYITTKNKVGVQGLVGKHLGKVAKKADKIYKKMTGEPETRESETFSDSAAEKMATNLVSLRDLDNNKLQNLLTETDVEAAKLATAEREFRSKQAREGLAIRGAQALVTAPLAFMPSALPLVAGGVQLIKDIRESGHNSDYNEQLASRKYVSGETALSVVKELLSQTTDENDKLQIKIVMNHLVSQGNDLEIGSKTQYIQYKFASPSDMVKYQKDIRDACVNVEALESLDQNQINIALQIVNGVTTKFNDIKDVKQMSVSKMVKNTVIATAASFGVRSLGHMAMQNGDQVIGWGKHQLGWNDSHSIAQNLGLESSAEAAPTPTSASPTSTPDINKFLINGRMVHDYENIANLSNGEDGVTLVTYKDGSTLLVGSDDRYIETKIPDTHWELEDGVPIQVEDSKIVPPTTESLTTAKPAEVKPSTPPSPEATPTPKALEVTTITVGGKEVDLGKDFNVVTGKNGVTLITNKDGSSVLLENGKIKNPVKGMKWEINKDGITTQVKGDSILTSKTLNAIGEVGIEIEGIETTKGTPTTPGPKSPTPPLSEATPTPKAPEVTPDSIKKMSHSGIINGKPLTVPETAGVTTTKTGETIITTLGKDGKKIELTLGKDGNIISGKTTSEVAKALEKSFGELKPENIATGETTPSEGLKKLKTPITTSGEIKIGATTEVRIGTNLRSTEIVGDSKYAGSRLIIGKNSTDAILYGKDGLVVKPKLDMHWELGKDGKIIEVEGATTIPPKMLEDLKELNIKTTGIKATEVVPVTLDSIKKMDHTLKIGDKEIKLPPTVGVRSINGDETAITTLGKDGKAYELVIGKNGKIIDGQVSPEARQLLEKELKIKLPAENIATLEVSKPTTTLKEALDQLKSGYEIPEGHKTFKLPTETYLKDDGKMGTFIKFDEKSLTATGLDKPQIDNLYSYLEKATGGNFDPKTAKWTNIKAMQDFFNKNLYDPNTGVAVKPKNDIVLFDRTKIQKLVMAEVKK